MHELEPIHFEEEWEEKSADFLKLLAKSLVIDMFVGIALFFALEIYLRVDSRFSYLIANKEYSLGHKLMRNSQGFRGPEYSDEVLKSEAINRILVIGDSTSFGSGVAWDSTYAAKMDEIFGDRYKVLNAGNQGDSIGKAIRVITETYGYTKPKWVVLGFSPSMVADGFNDMKRRPATPGGKAKVPKFKLIRIHDYMLQYCRVYAFLNREVRVVLYKMGVMVENLDKVRGAIFAYGFDTRGFSQELYDKLENTYDMIEKKLLELQTKLQDQGTKLLVVGIPSRFMISDLPIDNLRSITKSKIRIDPMEKLSKIEGLDFLNLEQILKSARAGMDRTGSWDPLYIRDDYAHLNELGHKLAAKAIAAEISRID